MKQSRRVRVLEEKVDSLLTILGAQRGNLEHGSVLAEMQTPAPTEGNDDATTTSPMQACTATSTAAPPASTGGSSQFDVIDNGILTVPMADVLINKYKSVHSTYFPFVVIAPEADTFAMRRDAPFLFLAIITTCLEGDHLQQRRLGVEMSRILSQRVLVDCERNLDLLQGLLVLLAWHHFHFSPLRKQLYMLLQVARTLVMDLQLDMCPAHRDERITTWLGCHRTMFGQGTPTSTECRRSTGEVRAFLGCFYLSSS